MDSPAQLSFVAMPRVLLRYHPWRSPPESTGPFELGTYVASLAGHPNILGEGNTERRAIVDLAKHLRDLASGGTRSGRLTTLAQALTAAKRLGEEDLIDYLEQRGGEARLA